MGTGDLRTRVIVSAVVLCSVGCSADGCGKAKGGTSDGKLHDRPALASEPPTSQVRIDVHDFITGLERPWDIAWLPNGTVLVTERGGRLNVYADGVKSKPTVIHFSDVVSTGGEGGLMGLEVDPDFERNRFVYVCMASSASRSGKDVRVARLQMRRPNARGVDDRQDVVTGIPHNDRSRGRHSGCRPRFGPDGFLWIGTGDAALSSTPQDDRSLGGKVLRVDRKGAPAPGNPGGRRWYSKGHRNVQGLAFRSDGVGLSVEHGPSVDDEINALVPGNFGWAPGPGYDESVPMTDLKRFPDAIAAAWSTGAPTLALAGATFVEGEQWGDWNGALVVAALAKQHLHLYDVDAEGRVTSRGRVVEDQGRLRTPRQGPDGLLYLTTDRRRDGDRVLRVTPSLGR